MVSYAPWQLAFHVHPDDRILYTEYRRRDRQLHAEQAKAEILRRHAEGGQPVGPTLRDRSNR